MKKIKNNKILVMVFCFIVIVSLSLTIFANDNPFKNVIAPVETTEPEIISLAESINSVIKTGGMLFIIIISFALPFI